MLHVFEKANLGKAPFRCVGVEKKMYQACVGAPIQPGGMCDYCGNGIMFCFRIKSSDGKSFVVGSECVLRTGDAGLKKTVAAEQRKLNREKAAAKANREMVELDAILTDSTKRAILEATNIDGDGVIGGTSGWVRSALSKVEWMWKNAGASGRLRALKLAKRILDTQ